MSDDGEKTTARWGNHPIALLHLIAQNGSHDPAFVVGNRLALTALRAAITAALESGSGFMEPFADDGEGYGLYVRCVASDDMESIPFGYTADYLSDARDWPEWMTHAR